MASIDFKALKEKVRLIDAVMLSGFATSGRGLIWLRGPCPFRCHPDLRCVRYDWARELWYCHRCHRGGGAIQFYAAFIGQTPYQAAIELCFALKIKVPWKERSKVRRPRQPRNRKPAVADDEEDVLDS